MIEYLTPEYNDLDDNNHHKLIRELRYKSLTQHSTANSQEKRSKMSLEELTIKRPWEKTT